MSLWIWLACSSVEVVEIEPEPAAIGLAECAVCGMTVNEQPSPRGQVQHRDGQHKHLCSLGDLRAYLAAPSPLGTPIGVWVEALPAGLDPALRDTSEQPWVPASQAAYLGGVHREAIMGEPMLSYSSVPEARAAQESWGGQGYSWEQLEATDFSRLP